MTDSPTLLGLEGGGTRTTALLARDGRPLFQAEFGPGNARLLDDDALRALLREIRRALDAFPPPAVVGCGLAGARTAADQQRVVRLAAEVWPAAVIRVTDDLDIALRAAPPAKRAVAARVLVLSGTGSCCVGRATDGRQAKVGGWGHHLGDEGSGHDIGALGLRQLVYAWDRHQHWGHLGRAVLAALQLNEPNDLIGWAQAADKKAVAALARVVFDAAAAGDALAKSILDHAAENLATDGRLVADRLAAPDQPVHFVYAGSVLLRQPGLARAVTRRLRAARPKALVSLLDRSGAWGAIALAAEALGGTAPTTVEKQDAARPETKPPAPLPPTEQRNPRSLRLDRLSVPEAVALFLDEESRVARALRAETAAIAQAVGWIARAFRRGGRLLYVGAGTSGRLGVLDASECPPTFGTPPDQVQGVIAGGREALWRAVEGAEDDAAAGAAAMRFRGVTSADVVVGIAASGRTPFVRGALAEARTLGARTVLLCFDPAVKNERPRPAAAVLAPDTGPELLTGSTRLKAGTATKLVLNMLTTLAMVRAGKVVGNLMVDVSATNTKLRARAVRIVRELTGAEETAARAALERHDWKARAALAALGRRRPRAAKRALPTRSGGG